MPHNTTEQSAVILVVDDEKQILVTLDRVISSLGYNCFTASDGFEAINLLKRKTCDLVLSDVFMPKMDGMDLLKHIIRFHFNTDVIIATGYEDRVNYSDVIQAGAIDFIKKPIDQAELKAKLARALRERHMIRKLETLSMCDGLTTLLNRRAYNKSFPHEVERAARQGYSLFLAMLDIDNFKGYNDTHGHDEGDKVLIGLGEDLTESTRNNVDLCFRLGGDEFAVLLPQTTESQAHDILSRVMHRFSNRSCNGLTLSIGIVNCTRDASVYLGDDIQQMQIRADRTMYEAKHSGKDRIVSHAQP